MEILISSAKDIAIYTYKMLLSPLFSPQWSWDLDQGMHKNVFPPI
jgi:hypothetical protein